MLPPSSGPNMETACTSEMSAALPTATQCNNPRTESASGIYVILHCAFAFVTVKLWFALSGVQLAVFLIFRLLSEIEAVS
jgi:hypothetical protein